MSEEVKEEVMATEAAEGDVPEETPAGDNGTDKGDEAAEVDKEVEQEDGADVEEREGEAGEADEAGPGGDDDEAGATPAAKKQKCSGPITLGYKTCDNSRDWTAYFKYLLTSTTLNCDFNEYEYRILLDLLQKGHPSAASKIGCGLRAFQVRVFRAEDPDSRAFYAVRKDGTAEDFSYIKCLLTFFPGELVLQHKSQHNRSSHGGRGGGGHKGRGRGGRSGGRGHHGRGHHGRGGGRH
ncbi:hypothetical protein Vretimale_16928 [Volvox reticuliferus]|uniref:Uncharacterized protein n=1 Tax=Volvox reticuliferus TaxID=1737510 RepID=A0A8J4CS84_9CHLO|nr:hypothetical protein Vretifemale_16780 [Volvox reticuliferus]GIM13850.1 hypothetical protein Vretimale_16928 [Volvox reticuliferus]